MNIFLYYINYTNSKIMRLRVHANIFEYLTSHFSFIIHNVCTWH